MAKARKTEKSTKIKKKNWYPIIAPKMFRNAVLGETLLVESKLAIGKPVKANLANLIGDFKKQHINIKFVVDNVQENKAYTSVSGYEMIAASVKRLTRRRRDKIELSFLSKTADNKDIRIKVLIFTLSLTSGSVKRALNNQALTIMKKEISKLKFEDLISDIITNKFQKSLVMKLKKIYPIKILDVKNLDIVKKTRHSEEDSQESKETAKKEQEEENKEEPKTEEKPKEKKAEEKKEKKPAAEDSQKKGNSKD